MAKFTADGFDVALGELARADLFTDENITAILHAGAEVMVDEVRKEMQRAPLNISHLTGKIRYKSGFKRYKDGTPYVTVTAMGKNKTGDSNSVILFVLNYGRSKKYGYIPPSLFWTKAAATAEPKITAAMQAAADKILAGKGDVK